MKTIEVNAQVDIPKVPNFILGSGKSKYRVADFNDATLEDIGKAWTANLKARAAEQRTQSK